MCEVDFSEFFSYKLNSNSSVDFNDESEPESDIKSVCESKSDTKCETDIDIHFDFGLINDDSTSDSKSDTESANSLSDGVLNDDLSSQPKSDTEFEGDISLEWHQKDYSKLIMAKYLSSYQQEKQYTTIVTVID